MAKFDLKTMQFNDFNVFKYVNKIKIVFIYMSLDIAKKAKSYT